MEKLTEEQIAAMFDISIEELHADPCGWRAARAEARRQEAAFLEVIKSRAQFFADRIAEQLELEVSGMTVGYTHGSGGDNVQRPFTMTHSQEIWRAPLWHRPFLWLLGRPTRTVKETTYFDCMINHISFGADDEITYDIWGSTIDPEAP